ncbi:L-galactono-1,4-lactone dehydrogenase isoform A [Micractinium conductrix]|uniref:L-galactono-1,4-lactone dehydrogenase isoform A n=1 Tax=Micractinium conductrix TaxID=554055 RepID=A0A2P6VRY0_9CHLO|nr:L-galactono-1,4-lactone dehydrogenase isoform A [Micractinium conductrix]|eukprot:PSC76820.1 L-galactono-1,4-lactone dehydrogenase isoform A [Micractinium conductrix]
MLFRQGACLAQRAAAASARSWAQGEGCAVSALDAAAAMLQRRGAAAAAKDGRRPPAQTHAPPPPPQQQPPRSKWMPEAPPPQGPPLTAAELAARERNNYLLAGTMAALSLFGYYSVTKSPAEGPEPSQETLVNWSGTHECQVQRFYQPESLGELEALVKAAHAKGRKLRCMGSGLSPNALAFHEEGMVSLAQMDRILHVDEQKQQVTVQAGARVQAVADELRKHGLTLQNYASIREQTVGGFTQVSAHGTGAAFPPVDEQVVALKLVTPALGTIELSEAQDPELFALAKVGLGCLGVAAEVTLQCVPAHRLVERTAVSSLREVRKRHADALKANRHLRYMWIPNTDTVVVVTCNPVPEGQDPAIPAPKFSEEQRLAPLRALLATRGTLPAEEVAALSATQLRDELLAAAPLDAGWVKRVNVAEAEYWRRCEGVRVGWSDELLGFDCGGQQWVLETAFPAGTREHPDGRDIAYMEDLLSLVSKRGVPAPAPIEQRWTAGSSAALSPAAGPPGSLHSWVGVIMYLPEQAEARAAVTASFRQYAGLVSRELTPKYNAAEHWAKIEAPEDPADLAAMQARLAARYPLAAFNAARRRLDPRNVLGSPKLDTLLGYPLAAQVQQPASASAAAPVAAGTA